MPRIVVVGEGMLELAPGPGGGGWALGSGGDMLNAAVHLSRSGGGAALLTALGADPFSDGLRAAWTAERLDPGLILTDPDRAPGLYAITNDAHGERTFTYWRDRSAARRLFALPGIDAALASAERAELLLFSLVTLAVLLADGRAALLALAARVRAGGGRVAFDSNYRPALWPDAAEARAAHAAACAVADIGLPTLEDEAALFGTAGRAEVLARWRHAGAAEVVLKLGAEGCILDGAEVPPAARLRPLDTSGAGDAFDAGYLRGRLDGLAPADAARAGHALAGWVVMRRGALPAADADAPYGAAGAG